MQNKYNKVEKNKRRKNEYLQLNSALYKFASCLGCLFSPMYLDMGWLYHPVSEQPLPNSPKSKGIYRIYKS